MSFRDHVPFDPKKLKSKIRPYFKPSLGFCVAPQSACCFRLRNSASGPDRVSRTGFGPVLAANLMRTGSELNPEELRSRFRPGALVLYVTQ